MEPDAQRTAGATRGSDAGDEDDGMSHFKEDDARSIIRAAYAGVRSDTTVVAESIYGADELAVLPRPAVTFALGVGHPVRHAALKAGEIVLDLGCGAGIDTLLAAAAVGETGRVIGLDMTSEMLERARANADAQGARNVEFLHGYLESIPLHDGAVDVVLTNGVLNLSTRHSRALAEMMRVLRPGGRAIIADLVLSEALPEEVLKSPAALAG